MKKGKNKPKGIIDLEGAVKENQNSPDLRILLGAQYSIYGMHIPAISQYKAALLLDSSCAEAYDFLIDELTNMASEPHFKSKAGKDELKEKINQIIILGQANGAYSPSSRQFI